MYIFPHQFQVKKRSLRARFTGFQYAAGRIILIHVVAATPVGQVLPPVLRNPFAGWLQQRAWLAACAAAAAASILDGFQLLGGRRQVLGCPLGFEAHPKTFFFFFHPHCYGCTGTGVRAMKHEHVRMDDAYVVNPTDTGLNIRLLQFQARY